MIKLVNGFGVVDMNKQSKRSSVEKQETELQRHTQSKMASTGVWGAGDGGKIGSTRVKGEQQSTVRTGKCIRWQKGGSNCHLSQHGEMPGL